jgi:hypothetical protein
MLRRRRRPLRGNEPQHIPEDVFRKALIRTVQKDEFFHAVHSLLLRNIVMQ